MRIQSVRREIAAAGSEQERTGIFTTSIISKTGQRQIALFFTGQKHAGENPNQLLQRRADGLDQPMQIRGRVFWTKTVSHSAKIILLD